MKEKIRWMFILFILLVCVFGITNWVNNAVMCGIQIVSKEEMENLTEGLNYIETIENIDNLIYYEKQVMPYDSRTNTFYVSQNINTVDFTGSFTLNENEYDMYIEKDDYMQDKEKAISEGHSFKIWILEGQSYMCCNLIFTGLPIMNFQMERELSEEKEGGYFILYNPYDEEVNQYSIKISDMLLKEAITSRTLSCELYKKDYTHTKKLNLLNIGKYSSWKLYSITEKERNPVSIMLSAYVWNTICDENNKKKLRRSYELVEVFLNGEYRGLYCLAPKLNKTYFDVDEDSFIWRIEDVASEERAENNGDYLDDFQMNNINQNRNVVDYDFFLQVTGSIKNGEEDFFILYDGTEESYYKIPAKYTFCFGEFPTKQGYLSINADTYMVEDTEFEMYIANCMMQEKKEITIQWNAIRKSGLSTDNILEQSQKYYQVLEKSGCFTRGIHAEDFTTKYEQVKQYVVNRMDYLDFYYNAIDGN